MTPELRSARDYLRTAQTILGHFRAKPNSPRWLVTQAEHRVLGALEWVWQAQCRAVLDVKDDAYFDTPECVAFINQIDWGASGQRAPLGVGLIRTKEPA